MSSWLDVMVMISRGVELRHCANVFETPKPLAPLIALATQRHWAVKKKTKHDDTRESNIGLGTSSHAIIKYVIGLNSGAHMQAIEQSAFGSSLLCLHSQKMSPPGWEHSQPIPTRRRWHHIQVEHPDSGNAIRFAFWCTPRWEREFWLFPQQKALVWLGTAAKPSFSWRFCYRELPDLGKNYVIYISSMVIQEMSSDYL